MPPTCSCRPPCLHEAQTRMPVAGWRAAPAAWRGQCGEGALCFKMPAAHALAPPTSLPCASRCRLALACSPVVRSLRFVETKRGHERSFAVKWGPIMHGLANFGPCSSREQTWTFLLQCTEWAREEAHPSALRRRAQGRACTLAPRLPAAAAAHRSSHRLATSELAKPIAYCGPCFSRLRLTPARRASPHPCVSRQTSGEERPAARRRSPPTHPPTTRPPRPPTVEQRRRALLRRNRGQRGRGVWERVGRAARHHPPPHDLQGKGGH